MSSFTQLDAIVCSPPYADSVNSSQHGIDPTKGVHARLRPKSSVANRQQLQAYTLYGTTPGQIGALKSGDLMDTGKEARVGNCEWLDWTNCYANSWKSLIVPSAFAHP